MSSWPVAFDRQWSHADQTHVTLHAASGPHTWLQASSGATLLAPSFFEQHTWLQASIGATWLKANSLFPQRCLYNVSY